MGKFQEPQKETEAYAAGQVNMHLQLHTLTQLHLINKMGPRPDKSVSERNQPGYQDSINYF